MSTTPESQKTLRALRIDFGVILAIIFCSIPIILHWHVRPMISAIFFYVLPTVYLFLRGGRKPIRRIIYGAALIGIGFGFIFDIILSANRAWIELPSQLVFPYYIFGFWPIDEPIWFFLWALFIIVFYEHFFDRETRGRISKRFRYIAFPVTIALFAIMAAFMNQQSSFHIPYAYFFLAFPSIIPVIYVMEERPELALKFLKTAVFFFMLYLVYEITAVKLGQWYFPGEYVGWVELGNLRFPFEELFFWMTLSSFTVLSLYEGFVDDGR